MQSQITFPVFVSVWNKLEGQTTPTHHLKIATWLDGAWLTQRKQLLLKAFRASGKSTLMGLFCVWLLWKNPNLRILVVAADMALAKKMVRQVKRIIERHPFTKILKPSNADQWGSDRFTLNRDRELRDPSMLAKGISSNLTGTRADIIICDDVEVPKTCDSLQKREDLRTKLLELDYILMAGGTQIYVGTPHHYDTIYQDKLRDINDENDIFLKGFESFTLPILNEKQKSVWPTRFSNEAIALLREKTGESYFQSQMMLMPQNISESRLESKALQFYDDELEFRESNNEKSLWINKHRLVSAIAFWDPAFASSIKKGDESILAILFTSTEQKYFLHHIESIKTRHLDVESEAVQQCQTIANLLKEFQISEIAIEINGIGKFLPSLLRREIAAIKLACKVTELTSRRAKKLRILEAFEAILAARSLFVKRSIESQKFKMQCAEWRPDQHGMDDRLDAVAGALLLQPAKFKLNVSGIRQSAEWQGIKQIILKDTNFKF